MPGVNQCFSFLMVSRLSSLSCEFGGLIHVPEHVHLPCMSAPAAALGTSFPSVLCPICQSHRGAPDTIEHLRWCCLSVCRPFSSALGRLNSEASWQVSSLAMSFLLDFSRLLFFLTSWSQAGILLSSFCLDRAGGSV